jgi:hypothetical protein
LVFDGAAVFVGVVCGAVVDVGVVCVGAGVGAGVGFGFGFDNGFGICALAVELKVIPEKTIDAISVNEQSLIKFFMVCLLGKKVPQLRLQA